ncbi:hypothetical protein BJX96DRAFT_187666 [Aspergillus floccosus]
MSCKSSSQQRLDQVLSHFEGRNDRLSFVEGPTEPPLLRVTLSQLLNKQCEKYGNRECVVVPWTGTRWTYNDLQREADHLARGLFIMGARRGDRVGVMACNCEEYISIFFAAAKIGAVLVAFNNHFMSSELYSALDYTECKILFLTPLIGTRSLEDVLNRMGPHPKRNGLSAHLEAVIVLRGTYDGFNTYLDVARLASEISRDKMRSVEAKVHPDDVCNLQFTSGSTGTPKAAMLTHVGLVNNSRFVGDRLNLTPSDTLCCPPPLFHCFGLVLGLLVVVTHGSELVLPSETFDPSAVLESLSSERCTAVHGVPTMFESILACPRPSYFDISKLRTGIVAGAPVTPTLMDRLTRELNMTQFTSSYGLTEASPTCFNAHTTDSIHTRLTTVGHIMPHAKAKIVDSKKNIVPIGQAGELYIAGYQVTKGYWKSTAKTLEILEVDIGGTTWLKTGDQAVMDSRGYCRITGRIKDIIIRGGENIFPPEIEACLARHPAIQVASVIGVPDRYYGEVVGAFIQLGPDQENKRPSLADLREWTIERIGKHKSPHYVFVLGENGVPRDIPVTGSGKVRKNDLRAIAKRLLDQRSVTEGQ